MMARTTRPQSKRLRQSRPVVKNTERPEDYRVGPGRPPKEHQFKPGQSGNPKGASRKAPSIVPDLKALLESALKKKVTLRQGDRERITSKVEAGIEQLVNQFAQGDRYARRYLIDLAGKLGVELVSGTVIADAIDTAISTNDQALLDDYVRRRIRDTSGPPDKSTLDKPDPSNSENQ